MKTRWIMVAALLAGFAAPARAMNWSLGANLGLVIVDPTEDGLESVTLLGLPSQGFITIVGSPGLRVGFIGESPRHQFYFDNGLSMFSTEGVNFTSAQFTANYQYNLTRTSTQPYVTLGGGLAHFRSEDFLFGDESVMAGMFGGGLGVQHRLGHGRGSLRAEIRLDHVVEDDGGVVPESNNIGLKFGFDLWMNDDTPAE